jgi:hypothetical protein
MSRSDRENGSNPRLICENVCIINLEKWDMPRPSRTFIMSDNGSIIARDVCVMFVSSVLMGL